MNIIFTHYPEHNHNITIQYHFRQIKKRYPNEVIITTFPKHMRMYHTFSSFGQYDIDFRDKDKGIFVASIIQLPYVKNRFQIKEIEHREGYEFFKNDDLIRITWNTIRNNHPFFKGHVFSNQ